MPKPLRTILDPTKTLANGAALWGQFVAYALFFGPWTTLRWTSLAQDLCGIPRCVVSVVLWCGVVWCVGAVCVFKIFVGVIVLCCVVVVDFFIYFWFFFFFEFFVLGEGKSDIYF